MAILDSPLRAPGLSPLLGLSEDFHLGAWELSFRSQFEDPFIEFSEEFPEYPLSVWSVWTKELVQLPTDDARAVQRLESRLKKARRAVEVSRAVDSGRLYLLREMEQRPETATQALIAANDCLDVPPIVFRDGWQYFQVVSFDEDRSRRLFRKLTERGPTELIRKREMPYGILSASPWIEGLFRELTPRQVEAILAAHRRGYYSSPRKVTTERIAVDLGRSSSTFEEHRRKAENRIIDALAPYLELYESARSRSRTESSPVPGATAAASAEVRVKPAGPARLAPLVAR
ncbi:MAG TPA: helix-turn-helix domain-containing protein [Thermoplasmata archaeon]|nr:helix-turn-helix domain-containing protein [Thermoplasmata archaeon]